MNPRPYKLLDVVVVIGAIALLLALILPHLAKSRSRRGRATCTDNLRQIGLAFRTWATEHNDLLPMQYYTNEFGAMKFADASNMFRCFQVMSNELGSPKLLTCPSDPRIPATNFGANFGNGNVGYFISLNANSRVTESVLSGDCNITNGTPLRNGILTVTATSPAAWSRTMHNGVGNILHADGSVRQYTSAVLQSALITPATPTNRLGMP
jgi:prepilin-type processing-associated H-X9-DG protein